MLLLLCSRTNIDCVSSYAMHREPSAAPEVGTI